MLNHARTLLMNVDGSMPYDIPGEELVPEAFHAVQLNGSLTTARRVLFGGTPDRYMLNYRCKQLMQILHATDMARFVYDLDPRISYSLTADVFSPNTLYGRKVTPMGTATKPLTVIGTHDPPDASGLMQSVWTVKVDDASTVTTTLLSPYSSKTHIYTMADGLSNVIPLPGTNMTVRFAETIGASWRIQSLVRPENGPGQLLQNLRSLPEEVVTDIFQLTSDVVNEPFKTFYQLWEKHHELGYRLGSFLMAMIYSTEKLR